MPFQGEHCLFLFPWFSVFHKAIYPSKDVPLLWWQLCVFKSFLWRTLEGAFFWLIVPGGISNLLLLHIEPSSKVCQSWYCSTKALSLLQYVLFACVVISTVFQNSFSYFVWYTLQGLLLCTYPGFLKGWCPISHVSLLVWQKFYLRSGIISFSVFSRLFLKSFGAWFIVFYFLAHLNYNFIILVGPF